VARPRQAQRKYGGVQALLQANGGGQPHSQGLTLLHFSAQLETYLAPFRSPSSYFVPYITQIDPRTCPDGAQLEL